MDTHEFALRDMVTIGQGKKRWQIQAFTTFGGNPRKFATLIAPDGWTTTTVDVARLKPVQP